MIEYQDLTGHFGGAASFSRAMYEFVFKGVRASIPDGITWDEIIYHYHVREDSLTFAIVELAAAMRESVK